ncbi:UNVERIFIED_CONTAM: hypothetical protein Sradi_4357800 [Sesamum radiatum]|uniref:Uncharacterized protein n=1 Tax=Sesamum radiatum TaxID=300843 RepID=A0AAW2NQN3_SESRA
MEDERKWKREMAKQENKTEKRKAVAALWPDGAGGGGATVINDGLQDSMCSSMYSPYPIRVSSQRASSWAH